MSSIVRSVASASTIMIATSPSLMRPATTMSKTALATCEWLGNATHCPSIKATRTPPIGPEKGKPASCVDIEAALIAITSYMWSGSSAITVTTI